MTKISREENLSLITYANRVGCVITQGPEGWTRALALTKRAAKKQYRWESKCSASTGMWVQCDANFILWRDKITAMNNSI